MTVEVVSHHPEAGEHRISDALFVAGARVPLWIAKAALQGVAESHDESEILSQLRVGQNSELFRVEKIRTQLGDTGNAYNKTATLLRKIGADELSQLVNIRAGDMSLFGWRPLTPTEHEMFLWSIEDSKTRDRWIKEVLPTRPGIISSYGNVNHLDMGGLITEWQGKAELDIKDRMDDSPLHRAKILHKLVSGALEGRLRNL